jgi:Dual specificity protein phosphatase, N-terminal half
MKPFVHAFVENQIYLAGVADIKNLVSPDQSFEVFTYSAIQKIPFSNDFGSVCLSDIHQFVSIFHQRVTTLRGMKTVFCVEEKEVSTATFLIGCYMITMLKETPEKV